MLSNCLNDNANSDMIGRNMIHARDEVRPDSVSMPNWTTESILYHIQSQRVGNRVHQRGLLHAARTQRHRNAGGEIAFHVAPVGRLGASPRVKVTDEEAKNIWAEHRKICEFKNPTGEQNSEIICLRSMNMARKTQIYCFVRSKNETNI